MARMPTKIARTSAASVPLSPAISSARSRAIYAWQGQNAQLLAARQRITSLLLKPRGSCFSSTAQPNRKRLAQQMRLRTLPPSGSKLVLFPSICDDECLLSS
eukprot:GHVU01076993.1.p2 GENE.GHVU01076993.1~~GHVU01076993.1.p2  ORF type:complete len:102 (+),score=2.99 GHVU01076993.1:333-638(+)